MCVCGTVVGDALRQGKKIVFVEKYVQIHIYVHMWLYALLADPPYWLVYLQEEL